MTAESQLRCLIAAGGTAGHVLPSLAVAEALAERGVSVTFAGSPERVEATLVPEAGFELDPFWVRGLPRRPSPALVRALAVDVGAPFACRRIIERRRPDVVLGGGGFVAGPMVLAAWTKRIPSALTEADAQFGLSNRLAAPFADRVFLAYEIPGRSGAKYRVVGRPVRPGPEVSRTAARRRFGLPGDGPALLVFGGSQGARALNEAAVEAFGADGPAVLHLSGERYYDELRGRASRPDYRVLPWTDDLAGALAACDLVLARAGSSVWEIAAARKPALLVPSPNVTADHQTKNARHFEAAGGAICVPEAELGRVPALVRSLLDDPGRLARMAEAMRAAVRPNAAQEIADGLIELARAGTA